MKKEYFISLSYKDEIIFNRYRHLLPDWINPNIFPAKDVAPDQMVSNDLLNSIRERDGLIYLSCENSLKSFWVTLERDYAIRLHKPVYYLDPINNVFTQDLSKPLELKIFPSYSRRDKLVVDNTLLLLKERHFDMFSDSSILPGEDIANAINHAINSALNAGGYSVFFISKETLTSEWVRKEIETTLHKYSDRIMPCLIDNVDIKSLPRKIQEYQLLNLYDERCYDHINKNRLDDLIVLLYWLIYQNTRIGNKSAL